MVLALAVFKPPCNKAILALLLAIKVNKLAILELLIIVLALLLATEALIIAIFEFNWYCVAKYQPPGVVPSPTLIVFCVVSTINSPEAAVLART
jgi:hypothetical protein